MSVAHLSIESACLSYKTAIELDLLHYTQTLSPQNALTEAVRYALLGSAKRLRPAFVRLIAQGLENPGSADEASLAVELFHTASLIADDLPCMDNDVLRRGRSSTHVVYGEATALLASYALIAGGYELIARNGARLGQKGAELTLLALENVAHNTGIHGATGGQWLDLFSPDPDRKTIEEIFYKKTVSLFEIAFVLGWLFGGGDLKKLPKVKQCAAHFGLAFQLADDVEDALQDASHVSCCSSVRIFGLEKARAECLVEIDSFFQSLDELETPLLPLRCIAEGIAEAVRNG